MILNGTTPTSVATIYTVPSPTPALAKSGNLVEINLFRFVNSTSGALTLSIYLNVNGTRRLLTPLAIEMPAGAAWDDVPTIQLRPGNTIDAEASGAGIDWTINAYFLPA